MEHIPVPSGDDADLVINAWGFLRITSTGPVRTTSPPYTTVLVILNDQSKFTAVDVGNSLADAISSPRYQDRTFAGLDIMIFPLTTLLRDLRIPGHWYIGDSEGLPGTSPSF